MRAAFVLVLALAVPVVAQDVPTGVTLATGYATGFPNGAIHSEARLRFASSGLGIEPMLSWTKELPYTVDYDAFCYSRGGDEVAFGQPCVGSERGEQAFAAGAALTYRTASSGLPLGLDGAHAGVFAQAALPLWQYRGQRVGIEAGVDARLGSRLRLGLDMQASRFTEFGDRRSISVSPLLRLAVGR